MAASPEDRSVPQLLSGLAREIATLVRDEVRLARAELAEKVSQAGAGAAYLAAGGAAAFAGLLFLLAAAAIALANVVAPWLSALLVGVVVTAVGVALLAKGRSNIRSTSIVPERTVRSVQEDVELAKSEVRR